MNFKSVLDLKIPLNNLKGINESQINLFKLIGINSILDLLLYMPNKSYKLNKCSNIQSLKVNEPCVINLKVLSIFKKGRVFIVNCLDKENNKTNITYFNNPGKYISSLYKEDKNITVFCTPYLHNNQVTITHPRRVLVEKNLEDLPNIENEYKGFRTLTNNAIKKFMLEALYILKSTNDNFLEFKNISLYHNLPSFKQALINIHAPKYPMDLEEDENILRISIDEMLAYHSALCYERLKKPENSESVQISRNQKGESYYQAVINSLPYKLTEDQVSAINKSISFIEAPNKKVMLLQGDVGCGKTIVCFLSVMHVIAAGYQVAFLAPTEVLAMQHYKNLLSFAEKQGISLAFLKGKETKRNKSKIIQGLKNKEIDIIIGTHAIIEDNIEFNNLGVVIIDEQHRFGVNQRVKLLSKGIAPKMVLTTATPIPRTLSLSLYGEIETVSIKQKPSNRLPIKTKLVGLEDEDKFIKTVKGSLDKNEKIFWVCTLIDEQEENGEEKRKSVLDRVKLLKEQLPQYENQIYTLTGRMKSSDKDEILNKFKNSKHAAILVSTTVIEVGVDIPDCNNIIIENAEMFGLAQLHQLRGRVGRGGNQGLCVLLYAKYISNTSKERLKTIKNTEDGFILAEKDLELRGYGNLIGTQQSGVYGFSIASSNFKSLYTTKVISAAYEIIKANTHTNDMFSLQEVFDIKVDKYLK